MIRPAACLFATLFCGTCATLVVAQVPENELNTIYATTRANPSLKSRGEIAQRVEAVLQKQGKFLVAQLHPWERDPGAALLTDGKPNEAGIRPNAHAAYGLAVLYRTTGDQSARDHALKILRFVLPTHAAWKNQWQSALWATSAGQAAWLLWDDLDAPQKWLAARMICDEADRFVDAKPPSQVERDTKAEENAWNSQVLALAFNMFPKHPNHARWRDAAIRWQISSFATSNDLARADVIDGKPLKEWLAGVGPNLHDDFTLENHDRVHPDYMASTRTLITQKIFYDWAGNLPPASLNFNARNIYANLKKLTLPDGGFIYPNAQDWHLHRNADWFDLHAAMAILFNDPQAARLMRLCLDTTEKMLARSADGGIYADGETIFPSSQAMLLELFADAYLLLRASGEGPPPLDETQLWKELAGAHRFDAGRFIVVRSQKSVATFSYGRQVMGMVLPLQKDLLLSPSDRGLIGVVDLKKESPAVRQWNLIDAVHQFLAVSGELQRGDGVLSQRFAFVALPDGRAVYADIISAIAAEPAPPKFHGGTIAVLNDRDWVHHDGSRVVRTIRGETHFAASKEANFHDVELSSPWYNLDDALGIVCLSTSGKQIYHERPTTPARGRREQLFHLNDSSALPAKCVLIFYPAQDATRTRDAAERCRLIAGRDPRKFSVVLDDGKRLDFDLNAFNVETP
ncbi:MAG: hypothetical protein QOF78_152 [Phycisphaerales bacterium]|nr:hypothetical protein [Phycisphaerales bacterium]